GRGGGGAKVGDWITGGSGSGGGAKVGDRRTGGGGTSSDEPAVAAALAVAAANLQDSARWYASASSRAWCGSSSWACTLAGGGNWGGGGGGGGGGATGAANSCGGDGGGGSLRSKSRCGGRSMANRGSGSRSS
uniref:Uncharacterized protein n=1 Tax=Triticum urartu TaxID=4572 RepID=A0A8R7UAA2_TRIUA